MSTPVMSLLPQFASGPAVTTVAPAASANGDSNAAPKSNGFDGLLASLSTAPAAGSKPSQQDAPVVSQITATAARDRLEQALSSLAGGKVDLNAPGLGLTAKQQQQLLSNLQKLLDSSKGDGAELLASLLAASQLAATVQPNDLVALTQLLGTTAQGTVSVDALGSNLHLLTQAVQLVANSGGKMTLIQAVQELTPPGDAFTQQLAAALAQPETQAAASEVPVVIDTGPPKGQSPGDAAGTQASANAGSNGREMTVTPTGATSPADGAVQEANSQAQTSPQVSELAKAIEALFQAQPQPKSGQPAQARAAAQPLSGAANQSLPAAPQAAGVGQAAPAPAPAPTTAPANQASASASAPAPAPAPANQAPAPAPADPAAQLAQMAPAQAVVAQAKVPVLVVAAAQQAAPPTGQQASGNAGSGTDAPASVAVASDLAAAVTPQANGQDHTASQSGDHQQPATASGQVAAVPVATTIPTTFTATLDASNTATAEASARPAVEQAVLDQIVQTATLALNSGQQEFRIQLKPDFLGVMEVRVSVNDGVVDVRMSAESAATRQLIDNNISQLRQAFGAGEVRVEHVPGFSASDAPWTPGQGGQQGFWQGQSPSGSSQLPEAIPFSESGSETAAVASATPDLGPQTPDPPSSAPGAIDLQA